MNPINGKNFGKRKRDCAWGCARGDKHLPRNFGKSQSTNQESLRPVVRADWFVLCDLQNSFCGVYPPSATTRTISFLFPIFLVLISIPKKRGSTSYIVRSVRSVRETERYIERERETERERERERERDGSDVTIVAPKLAMSLHLPLPRICTWRWVYTFPHQKFALFVSPFTLPVSPFLNGHQCGAEIRNDFSLSVAKNFAVFFPDSLKGRNCPSYRKNETN